MLKSTITKGLCGIVLSIGMATGAMAQEFQFSIHHFLSPKALTHTQMIEPWAKSIEEASGGRIQFEIFPAMSMGGKPPELYSQARDGVADIIWTVAGYTPGTFPRLEVFELPNVHAGDAVATNMAIQDMMGELEADLGDIHPLLVHVHTGNALHLVDAGVETIDDFKGLKIRSPSRTGAWMLEALGAEPVGMPVPSLPQALSKKTVDAGLVPFEIAIPLKLAELTKASVELDAGARFGTATFLYAMNKDSYNSLPDDLKKIIDDHSGVDFAKAMGAAWNDIEPLGMKIAKDNGNMVTSISADNTAAFDAAFSAVSDRWVAEVTEKGIDGAGLLSAAQAAVAANSQ